MTYRLLTDLATAVRKSGLTVVEIPGWARRGRPSYTGGFDPKGVLCHHTGGTSDSRDYVEWMALTGRSDLPAPLCQLALSRNGTVYVCAAGRANHAGRSRATGPMPAGDGNDLYIGIEAMNTGSEGWTDTQRSAYVRLCAALCAHYRWPATHVRAHRESSVTGKWDPGRLDMNQLRTDVAHAIDNLTQPEDDMPYTEKQLTDIIRAAVKAEVQPLRAEVQTIKGQNKRIRQAVMTKIRHSDKLTQEQLDEIETLLGSELS